MGFNDTHNENTIKCTVCGSAANFFSHVNMQNVSPSQHGESGVQDVLIDQDITRSKVSQ